VVIASEDFPEEAFRALVQAAPDGVLVADADGLIVVANPEIRRLTGYQAEELVGQPIELLVPGEARGRHVAHRQEYAAAPHARPMGSNLELWARRKDGSLLAVEIMLSPMQLGGRRATIAFARDSTASRRLRRELEEAHAAATAAIRELEAFSYSVAHDLRAPLRSVDGFAQALAEDYGHLLDEEGRDYLERVRAAAQRMGHLIDDLLALSRLSRVELRRERVELGALAQEAAARLRQAEPERQVALEVAAGLIVEADPRMLAVVFDNLLGNAWKFTRPRPVAHVEVGAVRGPGGAAYFVRDDGVGFDPQYASSLFSPFKRLHGAREFEGTGIGLATVARVIQRHGGRVWAESSPGAGATFYFTLEPEYAP
jgi:PAS domain S-box-containing protein